MGQGASIGRIAATAENDYVELLVRGTKELEHLLETHFNAPSGKLVGPHDKILATRMPNGV